jgi:hypothetical protein
MNIDWYTLAKALLRITLLFGTGFLALASVFVFLAYASTFVLVSVLLLILFGSFVWVEYLALVDRKKRDK